MPVCSRCGSAVGPGTRFCERCGASLEAPAAPTGATPVGPAAVGQPPTWAAPPAPVTVRRPRPRWVLPVVVAAVAVVVAVALITILGGSGGVDLARAASPDTELWMSIDVRPTRGRMAHLRSFLDALEKSGLKSRLIKELDKAAEEQHAPFLWEKDLKSWLGYQAAVAIPNLSSHLSGTTAPPILGMITIRDRKKAEAWLSDLGDYLEKEAHMTGETVTRDGLAIREFKPRRQYGYGGDEGVAFAISGKVLFISNDADEIASAAGRMKGRGESLAKVDWYRQVSKGVPKEAIATVAWSPDLVKGAIKQAMGRDAPGGAYPAPGGAVWLTLAGDRVEYGGYALTDKETAKKYAVELKELNKVNVWETGFTCLPKDAVAVGSVAGLSQLTKMALDWLEDSPFRDDWRDAQDELKQGLGLDLREDLIGWVDGASVALIGFKAGQYGPEEVHLVGEIRAKKGEQVEARVRKLEEAMRRANPWQEDFRTFQTEGVTCHSLPIDSEMELCYGAIENSVVFALSRGDLEKALRARRDQGERVTASDLWSKAKQVRGPKALLAVLVDVPRLTDNIKGSLSDRDLEYGGREAMDMMGAVNWAAISAGVDGANGTGRYSISVDWERLCKAINQALPDEGSERVGAAFEPLALAACSLLGPGAGVLIWMKTGSKPPMDAAEMRQRRAVRTKRL